MLPYLTFLFLLIFSFHLYPVASFQTIFWSVTGPGTSFYWDSTMWGITVDSSGYFYAVGWRGSSSGETDGWLYKSTGSSYVWNLISGCSGKDYFFAIDLDPSGGCVVAGYGENQCVAGAPFNTYVKKVSSTGASQWTWFADLSWNFMIPFSIKTLSNGDYIIAGATTQASPYIVRITNTQGFVWKGEISYTTGFAAVEEGLDGSIFAVTGNPFDYSYEYTNYFKYTSTIFNFQGNYPCKYVQFSSTGSYISTKDTVSNGYCDNIKRMRDGSFLLMGWTVNSGNSDSWVYKISATGNYQWDLTITASGSDFVLAANQMANGDIVLASYRRLSQYWMIVLSADGNLLTQTYLPVSYSLTSVYIHGGIVRDDGLMAISGHSLDARNFIKVPCSPGTYTTSPSDTVCHPCDIGYFQPSAREICFPCIEATYQDETGKASCKPCFPLCKQCTIATDCSACYNPYSVYIPTSGPPSCPEICPDPFYSDNFVCTRCLTNCAKCSTATNCFKCEPGVFLHEFSPGVNQCEPTCPTGFFGDVPTGLCLPCLSGCASCVSAKQCFECGPSLGLKHNDAINEDSCVSDCGVHYYKDVSASPVVCAYCDFRCLSCTGPANNVCQSCEISKGVYKDSTSCICNPGAFANLASKACEKCADPLCITCNPEASSECFECSTSVEDITYDPISKKCVCKIGFYRSKDGCKPCNQFCSECTGGTFNDCVANKCKNGAYPLENIRTTCLYMCQTPMDDLFIDNSEKLCKNCVPPCQSCFAGNTESCTSCKTGLLLYGHTCIKSCPDKYYMESNTCFPCDPKCKNCINRVNYCVDGCEVPYVYKDHLCLVDCGDGFTSVKGICEPCSAGCAKCVYENSQSICLVCIQGKYLYEEECLNSCPIGFYPEALSRKCTRCNEACGQCFGYTSRDCYSCNSTLGYIMIAENICSLPSCMDGSYFDTILRVCVSCPKECTKCTGAQSCAECTKGYNFDYAKKKCYDPCNKLGFTRKLGSFDCEEICGDGRNMGVLECDDGNSKDGDGCNSNCQVESYYECSGGNTDIPDVCIFKKPIDVRTFKYYASRTAVIVFDTKLKILDSLEKLITFSLTKTEDSAMEWSYEPFDSKKFNTIKFKFKFSCSLTGTEVF